MKYLLKGKKNQRDVLQKGTLKKKRYPLCLYLQDSVDSVPETTSEFVLHLPQQTCKKDLAGTCKDFHILLQFFSFIF